jgi:hypothetical protein
MRRIPIKYTPMRHIPVRYVAMRVALVSYYTFIVDRNAKYILRKSRIIDDWPLLALLLLYVRRAFLLGVKRLKHLRSQANQKATLYFSAVFERCAKRVSANNAESEHGRGGCLKQ